MIFAHLNIFQLGFKELNTTKNQKTFSKTEGIQHLFFGTKVGDFRPSYSAYMLL
jgi:hypothetical protein